MTKRDGNVHVAVMLTEYTVDTNSNNQFAETTMVIHSPYMIHAATQNRDPLNRMRLSTDIRYQRADDPIDRRWTNHWVPDDNL